MSKEHTSFDDFVLNEIQKEIERKDKKRKKIIFEHIRLMCSPDNLIEAFSTFNDFCDFMDKIEDEIKKDERWYEI